VSRGTCDNDRGGEKVVGVIGGMGPEATADLFMKVVQETDAQSDQQHLDVVVVSDPSVPDRSAAVAGHGEDPLPAIARTARRCIRAGADFLIMPCNTAHHFYRGLCDSVEIPVLHMMREVAEYLLAVHPTVQAVGLMATDGTVDSGLYQDAFCARDLKVLVPSEDDQRRVMEGIYSEHGVKAGCCQNARIHFRAVAQELVERGAEVIVAGCTEIPLALEQSDITGALLIDPTRILARAAVNHARGLN